MEMSCISIIRMIISDNRNNLLNQGPPLHNSSNHTFSWGGGGSKKINVLTIFSASKSKNSPHRRKILEPVTDQLFYFRPGPLPQKMAIMYAPNASFAAKAGIERWKIGTC